MSPVKKLFFSVFAIIVIIFTGVLGYRYIEDASFLDALYMTVITITTVGYAEIIPLSVKGRYFTILIILTGAATITFAATQVLQLIVAGELKDILGRRKMDKQIKKLKNHYIVCGYGKLGKIICEEFKVKNVPFGVIEKNEEKRNILTENNFLFLIGDATKEAVLKDANVSEAKGLISIVDSDAENVYIVLTAKGFKKDIFVITRANDEESSTKLLWAGADKVFSHYKIGGKSIANAVLKPNVSEFFEVVMGRNDIDIEVGEYKLENSSKLVGKKILESNIRKLGIIVIAIKKKSKDFIYNPGPETVLETGDTIIAIGKLESFENLEKLI